MQNAECKMQNAECRMQNNKFVRSLPAAPQKENHLRKSQVVLFTGEAKAEHEITILHSDFCILHFSNSQRINIFSVHLGINVLEYPQP